MSNIKEIEGVFINLDLVRSIFYDEELKTLIFMFKNSVETRSTGTFIIEERAKGKIEYKTKEEAEERIREIRDEQHIKGSYTSKKNIEILSRFVKTQPSSIQDAIILEDFKTNNKGTK